MVKDSLTQLNSHTDTQFDTRQQQQYTDWLIIIAASFSLSPFSPLFSLSLNFYLSLLSVLSLHHRIRILLSKSALSLLALSFAFLTHFLTLFSYSSLPRRKVRHNDSIHCNSCDVKEKHEMKNVVFTIQVRQKKNEKILEEEGIIEKGKRRRLSWRLAEMRAF